MHKLRESRWFGPDEWRLFCAVVETGFAIEIKKDGQENEESTFGIVQYLSRKGLAGTFLVYYRTVNLIDIQIL